MVTLLPGLAYTLTRGALMRMLLAVLVTCTLAGPALSADDTAQASDGDCQPMPWPPPSNCVGQSWLRNAHPYELGDLSALSPWTVYLVAEGKDPNALCVQAHATWLPATPHWVGVGPQNLGAPVVMLSARPDEPEGAVFYIMAWEGNDCAITGVYLPRDHGYGQ